MTRAIEITQRADIFIVIGSSLEVYPAASLLDYVQPRRLIFLIDPNPVRACDAALKVIAKPATVGTPKLVEELISRIQQRSPNE